MTRYRTVVIDPPWASESYRRPGWRWRDGRPSGEQRDLDYATMELDDLAALPIRDLAATDAHLYVWTTNTHLRETFWLTEAWGFAPSCTLVWCKEPRGFGPGGTFQSNVEFVLFARRGSLAAKGRQTTRWYRWPRSAHSAQPDAFLDLVEQTSPGPYVELFARRARFGWDYWGDESLQTAELVTA